MTDMQRVTRATYTIREAADRLGIGRNCAYDAAKRGDFPTIRIGKRIVVPIERFERWLLGQKEKVSD